MKRRLMLVLSSTALGMLALWALLAVIGTAPVRAAAGPPAAVPPAAPRQQTTTPTYVVSDSLTGGITYDWVEVSGTGFPIGLSGDNRGSAAFDSGFYFPFFDNLYRTFRVSTNGYIYFGGTGGAGGAAVPILIGSPLAPNNFIAPFGADFFVHPSVSEIYIDRQSTPRRTVIEFVDIQWCCGLNDPHTFEIILYPDGRILTQYRQVRFLSNPNSYVVAGIENAAGSEGVPYYEDWFEENPLLDDGLAVLYDPGDTILGHLILDPPAQTWWEDPGQRESFDTAVVNLTGVSTTFDITYSLSVSSSVVPQSLWPVSVPAASGPISNTGFSSFQVTVTIPVTAAWWDMASLHITVTSAVSATISDTVVITYGVAQRDLSIEKELDPDVPPAPGGYFRYRVTVNNDDDAGSGRGAEARDVQVTDTLPISATLLGFDPDAGSVSPPVTSSLVFTWDVGDIPAYGGFDLFVYMQIPTAVPTGTLITNSAWTTMLNSIERGPRGNNFISYTFAVTAPWLRFDVEKIFPGRNVIGPGEIATYTIRVENLGNVPVGGTVLSDVIPLGTTFYGTDWPTATLWPDNRTVVFTIGTLLNGGWNGLDIQVGISVPATTPIGTLLTNTVQVTTTAPLDGFTQAQGDSDVEVIEVFDRRANVWVVKYPEEIGGSPVIPEPGGDYTFWVNYGNDGNVAVQDVVLTDTLQPLTYLTLLDAGPAGTATPTTTPGSAVWHINNIAVRQDGWVWVRVRIAEDTPAGTQLINTAEIAASSNITLTDDVSVVILTLEAADVTVSKRVTPTGTLGIDDWVTYTVRFSNTGVLTATAVRITDVLPAGLTNVSWMTSGHPIEPLIGTPPLLVWRALQPLQTGDSGLITITGQLDRAATWPPQPLLTNRAEIHTTRGEEPLNDPNEAQVSNPVALASPYVVKTGPTLAMPGELLSYTIEYGNGGLLPAAGVRLTDTLPVSTTYVRNDSPWGEPISGTSGTQQWVAWDVGTLVSDTSGTTFTLVVSVAPGVPLGTSLYNTVLLTSSGSYDGDRTDNESVWATAVGFDLSGSYKQVNGTDGVQVDVGAPVTYTIVLPNDGPFDAAAVVVWDPLPPDTAYIPNTVGASSGDYGYEPASETITWTGDVNGYSAVTITFQVTVADAGPLPSGTVVTNTATISDGMRLLWASVPLTITGPDLSGSQKSYQAAHTPRPWPGERITYTIVLSNSGEGDASAQMSDALPPQVLYAGSGQASGGSLDDGSPPLITWTGSVAVGQWVTITLPVTVVAAPDSIFDNVALIDDGRGGIVQRSATVQVAAPELDVVATQKVASAYDVANGERVTFTITIHNDGEGPAPAAGMSDTIQDATYTPGAGGASSGTFDDSNWPTLTWDGSLPPGGSVAITIPVVISATPGSDVPNVAAISDGYGSLFTRSTSVHVFSPPDVSSSSKEVDQAAARIGATLAYTLTVDNSGQIATTFLATDVLDANTGWVAFVGSPPGSYGHAAGVITWTGTVNGESQARLSFQATISAGASGAVTNSAYFDAGPWGFYSDTATTLIVAPGLTATKHVTPGGVVPPGIILTYTVLMRNEGGDTAHVILSDTMPTNTSYVGQSAHTPPGYNPPLYVSPTLTWQDDIDPDRTVTLTFGVFIQPGTPEGTTIANVARLQESSEPSPPFSVTATNTVRAPIFSAYKWSTPAGTVYPGRVINYSIVLTNADPGIARVVMTDPIPLYTTYISGSTRADGADLPRAFLHALNESLAAPSWIESLLDGGYSDPVYDADNDQLTWWANIMPRNVVTLTFDVQVNEGVTVGTVITNVAWIDELSDPAPAQAYEVSNVVGEAEFDVYLPVVLRNH